MFQTSRQFQSSHADKHLSLRTGIGLKLGEVDGNIFVKDIVVGGACFYSEEVNVGDYLMSVDGVDVSKLSKSDIQQLMMGNVGTAVKLGLARRIDNVNVYNFIVEIQRAHPKEPKGSIVKVKGNLGITIQQMPDFTYEIAHIPEDSPLARDDMLRRRDRVWSVNGVNMDQLRCCDAVELFRNPGGGEMKLIVLRKGAVVNVTIDEELFNITAVESRTVLSPVFRSKRLGLSMHVNTDDGSVKIVFVERDGPAGKTRMLQCDDEIVAVNGYPIAEKTLDKVPKLDDLMLMFETAIDQVTVLTIRRENVAEEFEVAILQSSGQSEDKKISSISFPRPPLLRSAGDEVVSNLSLGLVLLRRPQKSIGFEVYEVKKHRPAMEVGLRAGDVLVGVDGLNVNGMEATDVEALLEGPVGTSVLLTILRTGDPLRMIRLQRQPLKEEREQIACVQMLRPVFASGETGK